MVATVRGFNFLLREGRKNAEDVLLTFRIGLRDWLFNHIVEEDQKYRPFFNEKGIS